MEELNRLIWSYIFMPCLLVCGLILSFRCGALQFRRFGRAMGATVGGIFSAGEKTKAGLSPLEAASTALAATVGTGNIIGTSQAIAMGGPGALFWLWAAALLGMIIKYGEIFLGLRFRVKNGDGSFSGGPMYYIEKGLGLRPLAVLYAALAALSVLSMGNMSQINGSVAAIAAAVGEFVPLSPDESFRLKLFAGLILALVSALILAGDVKRVGRVTSLLVPFMSLAFLLITFTVILRNVHRLPACLGAVIEGAFRPEALFGAAGGLTMKEALHWGVRRGAFSNEAGLGFAAIAHAPSDDGRPAEQGLWGIFEVFADTIVICSATALAILTSGVPVPWGSAPGPELLQAAFTSVFGGKASSLFMSGSLFLFSFSTVIGCSLFGIRCAEYVFGGRAGGPYRLLFSLCTFFGSIMSTGFIWAAADIINALMSLPNFLALLLMSGLIGRESKKYFSLKSG